MGQLKEISSFSPGKEKIAPLGSNQIIVCS